MPLYSVFANQHNLQPQRPPEHPYTGAIPFPKPWRLLRDAHGMPIWYVVRADTESGRVDRYDVTCGPDGRDAVFKMDLAGRPVFKMDLAGRPVVISEQRPAPLVFDEPEPTPEPVKPDGIVSSTSINDD